MSSSSTHVQTKGSTASSACFVWLFLAAVLFSIQVSAAPVAVIASDDNFITGGTSSNLISDATFTTLRHKVGTGGGARHSVYKFDLSGNPGVSGNATLEVTLQSADGTNSTYSLDVWALNSGWTAAGGELGTDWLETEINWANTPGWDNAPRAADMTLVDSFAVNSNTVSGTIFTNNITSLESYVQADNTVTFIIRLAAVSGDAEDLFLYSSESSGNEPRLSFEVASSGISGIIVTQNFVNVQWEAADGTAYQPQYTTNLIVPDWQDVGGVVTATSASASADDTGAAADPGRYYRVIAFE